jgi:general secretion pathway protein I
LPRATISSSDRAVAGFTLIEALVALAVVTITVTAIAAVMAATARGTRQLESHVALVQAAASILWLELPPRGAPIPPVLSGEAANHRWRADFEPLASAVATPAGDPQWLPQKVTLQVASPSGAMLHLETVRLFKRPAK